MAADSGRHETKKKRHESPPTLLNAMARMKMPQSSLIKKFPLIDDYVAYLSGLHNDSKEPALFRGKTISLISNSRLSNMQENAFSLAAKLKVDLLLRHSAHLVPLSYILEAPVDVIVFCNDAGLPVTYEGVVSLVVRISQASELPSIPPIVTDAWLSACVQDQLYINPESCFFTLRPISQDALLKTKDSSIPESSGSKGGQSLPWEAGDLAVHGESPKGPASDREPSSEPMSPDLAENQKPSQSLSLSPTPPLSADSESNDESNSVQLVPKRRRIRYGCDGATAEPPLNENDAIARVLEEMSSVAKTSSDKVGQFRARNYLDAARKIRRCPYKITSRQDALGVVTERMADKVEEILLTGTHRKLTMRTERDSVLALFQKVFGVGPVTADEYYDRGFRTLDDLRAVKHGLPYDQQVGLEYVDDLQIRIPRWETCQVLEKLEAWCTEIDTRLLVFATGSFRRGKESTGDMDFLITFDGSSREGQAALRALEHRIKTNLGLIVLLDYGSIPRLNWTCRGLVRVAHETPMRRIDFLVVPFAELGPALLYFTGSDYYNRSMRLKAQHNGMSLSQNGLQLPDEKIYKSSYERPYFELVGVPFRLPHEREIQS